MSDAIPLPPHPSLEAYEKHAKDLENACRSRTAGAIRDWAARWAEMGAGAEGIAQQWSAFEQRDEPGTKCTPDDARFFLARCHGFSDWPPFANHLEALVHADSPVSRFESAADTIVTGDGAALAKLLRENPKLVQERSTREHRSTLLHYVSANGIEDFRQKTPGNIIEITRLLLEAGADVNAESDAYSGRSTTLGLTATSCHPEDAGLQLPLMQLLIDHGATLDGSDGSSVVNSCLHNGRGQAAAFLAGRGARLDLEGAAGAGRLDVVKAFFGNDGALLPPATPQQMSDGFAWACQFGRIGVVDFLLRRGMDVGAKLKHHGGTGLHWAAYGGHADTVKLLLQYGAKIDGKDESYSATPLGWALHAWENLTERKRNQQPSYYEVVSLLVQKGAAPDPNSYQGRADPRMLAALRGETPSA